MCFVDHHAYTFKPYEATKVSTRIIDWVHSMLRAYTICVRLCFLNIASPTMNVYFGLHNVVLDNVEMFAQIVGNKLMT